VQSPSPGSSALSKASLFFAEDAGEAGIQGHLFENYFFLGVTCVDTLLFFLPLINLL
jgi:hypothetical protein